MSKNASDELKVFVQFRQGKCSGCGSVLWKDSYAFLEEEKVLCMACAELDHLVVLPSGDPALTLRSKKYSKLWAVILKFSRARRRCERQGLLVEEEALDRAQRECLSDEEYRREKRARDAVRRNAKDAEYLKDLASAIRQMFPNCPAKEVAAIVRHTGEKGSGRVGRSAAAKALEEEPLRLAVAAAVRHRHTNYDELLMQGVDRYMARREVAGQIDRVLREWSGENRG